MYLTVYSYKIERDLLTWHNRGGTCVGKKLLHRDIFVTTANHDSSVCGGVKW